MRDTDRDWQHYGAFEPYYGVLTHERFLRANLTPETLEEFWASGRVTVQHVWSMMERLFGYPRPRSALDFGCGVGRLTHGMCDLADEVIGLDVSTAMVREAERHGRDNARFVTDLPDCRFDWINSFIVFQHIPPSRGYDLLEQLLRGAADTCLLSLHFTFFKDAQCLSDHALSATRFGTWDGQTMRPILPIIADDAMMMMYDYDLTKLYAILLHHRFTKIYLDHTDHGGAQGAIILAAR